MRSILSWLMMPIFLLTLLASSGCSKESTFETVGSKIGSTSGNRPSDSMENRKQQAKRGGGEVVMLPEAGEAPPAPGEKKPEPEQKPKAELPRKIRYTADLHILVDELEKAREGLMIAVKDADADVASSSISKGLGNWRIRVPVKNFESFREALLKLGKADKNDLNSEDLTAQYYDLKEHIKNRMDERIALRDLLKEVGKIDIKYYLDIKRELDSVTDDINRKEGQLKLWENLTDRTTVTVVLREIEKFNPAKAPSKTEVPTFGMRAEKTFNNSWESLIHFGEVLTLVVVAVAPWLPIFFGIAGFVWVMGRIFRRKPAPTKAVVTPPPVAVERAAKEK